MPIFLLLLALFVPRIVIVFLWFFTEWFPGAFVTLIIPVAGFLFLPYTLLWYGIVQYAAGSIWGFWQIVFLALALLLDFSPLFRRSKYE